MFESFCAAAIRNFGRNLKRAMRNRQKHDGTGEESVEYLIGQLSTEDVYTAEQFVLEVDGLPCVVENELLYNALLSLPDRERRVILYDFWYTELLKATVSEQISNLCIVDGTVWVYLVKSKKLVGLTESGKKEITVTGADELYESTTVDVVLSISGGALYLGQNGGGAESFILYECAAFSGATKEAAMTKLDVASKKYTSSNGYGKTEFANFCIPRVSVIRGMAYVVLGYSKPYSSGSSYSTSYSGGKVHYVCWTVGEFESTAQLNTANEFRNYYG